MAGVIREDMFRCGVQALKLTPKVMTRMEYKEESRESLGVLV